MKTVSYDIAMRYAVLKSVIICDFLSVIICVTKEVVVPNLNDLFQTADWKAEKHVPVIEVPAKAKKGELFKVAVSVGKEIAHPNKTEHHIRWISIFFHPKDEKFPYQVAKAEFSAHGESTQGPDTSTVYTHHEAVISFKTDKPGTILASSYCNIHGLWQNSKEIGVE